MNNLLKFPDIKYTFQIDVVVEKCYILEDSFFVTARTKEEAIKKITENQWNIRRNQLINEDTHIYQEDYLDFEEVGRREYTTKLIKNVEDADKLNYDSKERKVTFSSLVEE
jgi:predicted nucleic-acid-binding protein